MTATAPTLAALTLQFALGLAVFQARPRRQTNQCFLLLSIVIGAWLGSLYFAFTTTRPSVAEFYIREAWATGSIILSALNLLRLAIRARDGGWPWILRRSWLWLTLNVGVIIFCQTKFFLIGARIT